jgi:hypothetical protein
MIHGGDRRAGPHQISIAKAKITENKKGYRKKQQK